jgi:thiol:disulfide interchange protein DsbA
MKKFVYAVLFLLMASGATLAKEYKEGVDYQRVSQQETESGDMVEVLEFFWYGCSHCFKFEPVISSWIKQKPSNVKFIRVPAIFRPEWKVHARTYYTLQVMGLGEKLHSDIFDEIQVKKNRLDTEASMTKFVTEHGVNKNEFTDVYNSFAIESMMRKAIKKIKSYKIQGVPALSINGKYVLSGKSAGTYENMMQIANHLISKESASSASKAKK